MNVSLQSIIRIPESTLFSETGAESVLLNKETEIYFGLCESGSAIWKIIEKSDTLASALDSMCDTFTGTDKASLERDLMELGTQLHEYGLVDITNY